MQEKNVQWVLRDEKGLLKGPYSTTQILKYIQEGVFLGSEMISQYPNGSWNALSQEPEFYDKILEALESQLTPSEAPPEKEETIIMRPPPRKAASPIKIEVESGKLESLNSQVTKPVLTAEKRGLGVKSLDGVESPGESRGSQDDEPPVIEMQDLQAFKRKKLRKKNLGPALLLGLMVMAGIYLIIPDGSETPDRISLLMPQKGGKPLGNDQIKERLNTAVRAIEKDTFEYYLEAQNKLVSLVEGAPTNLEVRGLLCYVYKELWPFSKQDAHDVKAIGTLSQTTRVLNIGSPNGIYCEAVKLYVTGRFKEAKGTIEGILENNDRFSLLPIVYQFKAEIIDENKDSINSVPYFERAGQIWPAWIKPKVSLGFALLTSRQGPKAAEAFRDALSMNPHHKLAKVGLGLLEYKVFKQFDSALTTLSAAVENRSRIPRVIESEAYYSIAEILSQKGEIGKAREFTEKAYGLNPSSYTIKQLLLRLGGSETSAGQSHNESLSLGDQYFRSGDFLAAQAEYKTAFELNPKNAGAALKAAKSLWSINQSYEAIEWLKKALKADPKLIPAYVLQADYLSQRYDFSQAAQILTEAIRQNRNNPEILKGLALLEFRKNNMKGALAFGLRSLKIYDADIETIIILARASRILALNQVSAGEPAKREAAARDAIRYATKAVELDSTNSEAQIAYAEMLAATSGIDTGITYLRELIKKYSFSNEYRVALGDLMRTEDRFAQAREVYEQVIAVDQRNKKALLGLGLCYRALALNDSAITAFLNAAIADPTDAEPLFQAARVYQDTNRFDEAITQFRRVAHINPNFPLVHYNIGRTAFMMGNLELALSEAKIEKKHNPKLADSYILAAEVTAAKHQYSECAGEYSIALKLRPQGAAIYVKAAQCYRKSGAVEIAEDMIELAKTRESGYAEIYRELGFIFQSKGDTPAATRSFEKYLELSPNAPDQSEIEGIIK